MKLTLTEAAHRLRMTVTLLEWCARYAPKQDGRKLQIAADRTIDEAELAAFEAHLIAPWANKYVCAGIKRELDQEARGRCGLCRDHTDAVEAAHIDRLGEELEHHSQHPHNLINLCSNCHTRYDVLKTIENHTVKHAKRQLISQLMEDVDRDIAMTKQVQEYVRTEGPRILAENRVLPLTFLQGVTAHAETVVTGSAATPPTSPAEARERLTALSGSIVEASPFTSRLLLKYESSIEKGEVPPTEIKIEELFDDRPPRAGHCWRCGSETSMENASCSDCGEGTDHHDVVTENDDGTYALGDVDVRGDVDGVVCGECGSDRFDVEFRSFCDYCEHMSEKLAYDD